MTTAKRLLALDSAGSSCSAALWAEGRIAARRLEAMARGQSERLVPMIEEVMSEARMPYEALDAIAVTLGPGGFTGVRIGLATARGLALACGRPLIGVSSFEAMAASVSEVELARGRLAVVLDAKRAEVYVQAFNENREPVTEPCLLSPQSLAEALPEGPLVLAGDAVAQVSEALEAGGRQLRTSAAPPLVDAAQVAAVATRRPLPAADAPPPRPLYLRKPDVTLPAQRGDGDAAR